MTVLKQKGNQGLIRVIKASEYEYSKKDFKCCDYWEKWTICQTTARHTKNPRAFLDKVTTDIDDFIDEPVIQCDIQVKENTFVDDSK